MIDAPSRRPDVLAGIGLIALYLVWGSTYFPIHIVLEVAPPLGASALRFAIAGGVLLAGARIAGEPMPTRPQWTAALALGCLFFVGGNAGVVLSQTHVSSGIAALLVGMMPMWVVVIEAALGHRPSGQRLIGVVIGACGVTALAWGKDAVVDAYGLASLLVSTIAWATGTVLSRHVERAGPLAFSGAQMVMGGASLGLVSLLAGEGVGWLGGPWQARHVLAMSWLLVGGSVLGFTLFTWLLRRAGPAITTTYAFVNPVVAVAIGGLFGEPVSSRVIGAGALIVLAVAIITAERRDRTGGA